MRTVVRQTYFATALTTVFTTARAFTVKKDVLPTQLISHVIYHFECRHCDSRYVGRTLQHLNARVKQHVPLYLLSDGAKAQRPGRGRPRKQVPVAQLQQNHTVPVERTTSTQVRETEGIGQTQVRRPVTRSMTRALVMTSTTGHGLAASSSVGLSLGQRTGWKRKRMRKVRAVMKRVSWTTKMKMTGLKVRPQRKGQPLRNTSCLVANAAQCMMIHASLFCVVLVGFVNLRY